MARLARAHVLSDVAILADPEGKPPHHRPRLGAPDGSRGAPVRAARRRRGCRGGPQRPVRGSRGGRNAPERPALRCVRGVSDGGAAPIDEPAQRGRRAAKDWPEDRIDGKLRRQALHERRREDEVVRRERLRSLSGPRAQREFRAGKSAKHTSARGGLIPPPPRAVWRGVRPPPSSGRWRRLPLRRVECAPTPRGWRRVAPARVRRDRGERRAPADSLGPGRPSTPRGRRRPRIRVATPVACAGRVRHVEAEVLDRVEPADVHLVRRTDEYLAHNERSQAVTGTGEIVREANSIALLMYLSSPAVQAGRKTHLRLPSRGSVGLACRLTRSAGPRWRPGRLSDPSSIVSRWPKSLSADSEESTVLPVAPSGRPPSPRRRLRLGPARTGLGTESAAGLL